MEMNTVTLVSSGIVLLLGIVVGFFLRKMVLEGNQANIESQRRQIVENAILEAEQIKKEASLQSKEDAYQSKQEAEKEIQVSRRELKDEQRRLDRKLDEVQHELGNLEKKGESSCFQGRQLSRP